MDKKKLLAVLDRIFELLSPIPVSHDNVDRMALARQELRALYKMAEETAEETGKNAET